MKKDKSKLRDKLFTYREALGLTLALLTRIERGDVRPDQIRTALIGAPMAVNKHPKLVNPKLLHLYDLIAQLADKDQGTIKQLTRDLQEGKEIIVQ